MKNKQIVKLVILFFEIYLIECQKEEVDRSWPEMIESKNGTQLKILFGSCNKHKQPTNNSIFETISKLNPDTYIWLGDAAYVDIRIIPPFFYISNENITQIIEKFNYTLNDFFYQKLLKSTRVIGIWDDHDYNLNDGDKHMDMKNKEIIKKIYLDFIQEDADSIRRKQKNGIYSSYLIKSRMDVLIVLLDVRHEKDKKNGDMLGEEQWLWLEKQLKNHQNKLTVICSGTQVMPDDRVIPESWFPKSKRRLYKLIQLYQIKAVLLSGDVHFSEIMKHPCLNPHLGYPLYEITTSAMSSYYYPYFLFFRRTLKLWPQLFNTQQDRFIDINFGGIVIDWNLNDLNNSILYYNIYDQIGQVQLQRQIIFNEFYQAQNQIQKLFNNSSLFDSNCILSKPLYQRYIQRFVQLLFDLDIDFIFIIIFLIIIAVSFLLIFRKIFQFNLKILKNIRNFQQPKNKQ